MRNSELTNLYTFSASVCKVAAGILLFTEDKMLLFIQEFFPQIFIKNLFLCSLLFKLLVISEQSGSFFFDRG